MIVLHNTIRLNPYCPLNRNHRNAVLRLWIDGPFVSAACQFVRLCQLLFIIRCRSRSFVARVGFVPDDTSCVLCSTRSSAVFRLAPPQLLESEQSGCPGIQIGSCMWILSVCSIHGIWLAKTMQLQVDSGLRVETDA